MSDEIMRLEDGLAYVETDDVFADAVSIIEEAQLVVHRAIDATLVRRNWLLGKRIVNEELRDGTRSEVYGRKVVPRLATQLTQRFGKGFTRTSLYQYVRFYRMFP